MTAPSLNIAVLSHASAGGSGVVATELGLEVARAGHSVHFVGSALPFRLTGKYCPRVFFHQTGSYAYALFEQPFPEIAAANTLCEVILEHDIALTHAHYAIPHASAAMHARSITGKGRVLTTLHGTDVTLVGLEPAFLHTTRHAIERSDAVTAVSHYLAEYTRERMRIGRDIEVIHNFVDAERFRPLSDPGMRGRFAQPEEAVVVHVSNFRPVKRTADVIEVFARIASELPARLLLVGDGPERPRAFERARELGILGRTQFLGSFPGVEEVLGIADLFLLPSAQESFGLVALEAMACEVPVVASNIGGIPEVVAHGETGYLCDLGDTDGMAHAALGVLRDPAKRRRLGEAARRRAVTHFSPGLIVPQYLEAYRRTVMG